MEVLKQGRNSPLSVEHQVIIIYAVVNNYLKKIAVEDISEFEKDLFDYIDSAHPDITQSIRDTKDLTKENEENLKTALELYVEKFLQSK